jgi:hypothetical protein
MRVALQLRLTGSTLEDAEELDQALKQRRFLGQPLKSNKRSLACKRKWLVGGAFFR